MDYNFEKLPISVYVLTYNEIKHIDRLLDNLAPFGEIIVVDSHSTDGTVDAVARRGYSVYLHPFENQAAQMQWAMANIPTKFEWQARFDADEILSESLIHELAATLPKLVPSISGINLHRMHVFMGKALRFGGRYPTTLLRVWRAGEARVENRSMDEHMVLLKGNSVTMKSRFYDHNLNDLTYFIAKHNDYSNRESLLEFQRRTLKKVERDTEKSKLTSQAWIRRVLKNELLYRLPIWLGPGLYFFYRYIIRFGFLDGRQGLIYHVLQGFWYRFLVASKISEMEDL